MSTTTTTNIEPQNNKEYFAALPTRRLKSLCEDRGITHADFLEKSEFVTALINSKYRSKDVAAVGGKTVGAEEKAAALTSTTKTTSTSCTTTDKNNATVTTSSSTPSTTMGARVSARVARRLKAVLGQDRGVVDYRNYNVCDAHRKRVANLPAHLKVPRERWFTRNSSWSRNSRGPVMPMYHVHFREESQECLRLLFLAYREAASASDGTKEERGKATAKAAKYFHRAQRAFDGCTRGLGGHVSIEERHYFPQYQARYPDVDMSFLWSDHKDLHETETRVRGLFRQHGRSMVPKSSSSSSKSKNEGEAQAILTLVDACLDFDTQLINHLGEEEEVIVPMELNK